MTASPDDLRLLAQAEALLTNAHSPYSRVRVAAVALGSDGRVHAGVNVENSSLGLTVCAERNALFRAVGEAALDPATGGRITTLIFTSNHPDVAVPCGACRQVICELAPEARILFGRGGQILRQWGSIRELLPEAFDGTWKIGSGPA